MKRREQLAIARPRSPRRAPRAEVVHETVELRGRHSECPHGGEGNVSAGISTPTARRVEENRGIRFAVHLSTT